MSFHVPPAEPGILPTTRVAGPTGPVIRIAADLVCPWCWIGFTRLLRAIEGENVHLVWEPFLLNPHLPVVGVPRMRYLERRYGGLTQARAEWRRAAVTAAVEGLELGPVEHGRQPSTVVAHAVVLAAAARGRLVEAATLLFSAALGSGRDIGEPAALEPITERLGIHVTDLVPLLPGVLGAHNAACRDGIDGVPMFRFGDDHAIAGAQPVEALRAMVDLERHRLAAAAAARGDPYGRQAS